jgi:hypothetical protein
VRLSAPEKWSYLIDSVYDMAGKDDTTPGLRHFGSFLRTSRAIVHAIALRESKRHSNHRPIAI